MEQEEEEERRRREEQQQQQQEADQNAAASEFLSLFGEVGCTWWIPPVTFTCFHFVY